MNKILLIISREYLSRVKKKSFWILTIVVPLFLAALYAVPVYLAMRPQEKSTVLVVDDTGLFDGAFKSSKEITYRTAGSVEYAQRRMDEEDSVSAVVYIPARETTIPSDAFLYYKGTVPSANVQSDVSEQLQSHIRTIILQDVYGISQEEFDRVNATKIKLHTKDLETGKDGFLEIKMAIGLLLGIVIFFVVMNFGGQVMTGVSEEKTSRIVEVIMSSVKPFQLMMGKVVGIGLVGLTQFALWILLSLVGLVGIQAANPELFEAAKSRQSMTELATKGTDAVEQMQALDDAPAVTELLQGLTAIDFGLIISMFLLFFVLSGAELDLSVLPQVGLIGVGYLALRSIGKWGGTMLGALCVHADENIKKYLGLTLLPQAGVAIGMASLVSARFPTLGAQVNTIVLAGVLVFELVGPVITKLALTRAGEIKKQ